MAALDERLPKDGHRPGARSESESIPFPEGQRQPATTTQIGDGMVPTGLRRGLSSRQLQMIALGGTLGVGLFLGSSRAIERTGPGLALLYLPAGLVAFLILRALGEMTVDRPVAGSFTTYAHDYVGKFAGFITGWTYWFAWVVTCMAELTAMGTYVDFWISGVPHWVTAIVILAIIFGANLFSVKVFGEAEYWFALIKIVAIVGLIVMGVAVIGLGVDYADGSASITNLWEHGGVFPKGADAALIILQNVMFAFFGLEFVGVTAAEAKDPQRSIPRAINTVALRMFVFYFGALVVIMSVIPWTQIHENTSPFVVVFSQIGVPAAATIMNCVILTAALSSSNSGIFSTSRMLHSLALKRQAPAKLSQINKRKIPSVGVFVSVAAMFFGVIVNYLAPKEAFVYFSSIGTIGAIIIWVMIIITHLKYRQSRSAHRGSFRLPFAPGINYVLLAFMALIAVLLWFNPLTRIALYVAPIWIVLVSIAYLFIYRAERARRTALRFEQGMAT